MLNFIENSLYTLRNCFSRKPTFNGFVVVILGLMTRSDAFSLKTLKQVWHHLICKDDRLYKLNGKPLLLGDGTKHPKEGRYMPGVKKLFQESENSSNPSYIFGHMYGVVAAVIHRQDHYFAIPSIFLPDIIGLSRDTGTYVRSLG